MTAATLAIREPRRAAASALMAGTVVGVLDGIFAVVLHVGIRQTITTVQLFQAIATALLGPAAFRGGLASAALGLALHFTVALTWSAVFLLLSRLGPVERLLQRRYGWVAAGALFGPCVWLVMDLLVLPLTRARAAPPGSELFYVNLIGHVFVVGLPIAGVISRAAAGPPERP